MRLRRWLCLGMGLHPHWSSRYSADDLTLDWLTTAIQRTREVHRTFDSANLQESTTPCSIHSVSETPHQLSLSRLRKIVPEEHHLYSAVQSQTSPGIQTYRDTRFPARQIPREHQIAAWISYRFWTVRTDVEDPRSFTTLSPPNQLVARPRWAQQYKIFEWCNMCCIGLQKEWKKRFTLLNSGTIWVTYGDHLVTISVHQAYVRQGYYHVMTVLLYGFVVQLCVVVCQCLQIVNLNWHNSFPACSTLFEPVSLRHRRIFLLQACLFICLFVCLLLFSVTYIVHLSFFFILFSVSAQLKKDCRRRPEAELILDKFLPSVVDQLSLFVDNLYVSTSNVAQSAAEQAISQAYHQSAHGMYVYKVCIDYTVFSSECAWYVCV